MSGKTNNSGRRWLRLGRWLCLFTVVIAAGITLYRYGRSLVYPKAAHKGVSSSSDVTDINVLRSLPYVGSVKIDEDEGEGVVFWDSQRSSPGYSLYSVHRLSMAELIDQKGNVINRWSHKPSRHWSNCELLPNGDLLAIGAEHGTWPNGRPLRAIADDARYLLRFNWQGRLLWKRKLHSHHDIEVTRDGKLLLLTFQRRLVPSIHPTVKVRDDQLTLLEQDGTVTESHSMLEAVWRSGKVFPLEKVKPTALGGPLWIDIFHSNSIEWMRYKPLVGRHPLYDLGNILVCFRHQSCIAVFNWERNEVVWSWGRDEIHGPHDAQVLANGYILLFDNGLGRGYSRVIELDPVREKIVWEYKADPLTDFYSASKGSSQRLPNGNTLIAESDKGRAFEVTREGDIVWEFLCPHEFGKNKRAALVRIKRYQPEFIEAIINKYRK